MLPEAPGNSQMAPLGSAGHRTEGIDEPVADCFYIHPTMHLRGTSWNAAVGDERIGELVDQLVVPGQASAFARSCRIYAPRYRQATLYSFVGGRPSGRRALELAYSDVRAAFEQFLEQRNQGRPYFVASHSQGSCHAIRLLEECIEPYPERCSRLVAAYVIGYTFPRDKFADGQAGAPNADGHGASRSHGEAVFERLHPCRGPLDNGCVVAWDTFGRGGGPLHRSDRAEVWYSGAPRSPAHAECSDGSGHWRRRAHMAVLGINPLTFETATGWVGRENHRGAVHLLLAARVSPTALFSAGRGALGVRARGLSRVHPMHVDAGLAEDGYLYISEPWVAAFQQAVMPGRSFHNHDYGLFYADLEENVAARLAAFVAQRAGRLASA